MLYCHHCGKKNVKGDLFCSNCGKKLAELLGDVKDKASGVEDVVEEKIEDVREETERVVEKTSSKGLFTFIILLLIIGYVILDVWAATQIRPEMSLDNLLTIASNLDGGVGYTSALGSTKIIFENPTFVPIILFPVKYNAGYDDTDIITGKTGFVFIAPYSSNEVSASARVSYAGAGVSVLKGFVNVLTGRNKEFYVDFYEFGFKFVSVRG